MGATENERCLIYEKLAFILHLGNIEFESNEHEARIIESSKQHINIAAELIEISPKDLEEALLFRSIEVAGSTIMWAIQVKL